MLPGSTMGCSKEAAILAFSFSSTQKYVGFCSKKQKIVTVRHQSSACDKQMLSTSSIEHFERFLFFFGLYFAFETGIGFAINCAVRFRPCIDIHKGKVKQIVGSTLKDLTEGSSTLITNFESDKSAAEFARMYEEDELTGGHVIMLGADPLSVSAALEALHAYPGGLQIGGGITSENALFYLDEGASHVIVTSFVFSNGKMDLDRLRSLVEVVGKERLVLDLSCRKKDGKYAIVTDRWQKFTDVFLDERTLKFLASYADEFLVHGVDVEGKRLGIDEELVALLGNLSPISVTYAGGVNTMEDLDRIKIAGLGRVDVTVGSALDIFGGNLAFKDVVAWHRQQLIKV